MSQETVFITGGTGSVGRALVETFCRAGYKVAFQYHQNQALAEKLSASFEAEAVCIDFSTDFHLPRTSFDILVNNAGINITDASSHEVSNNDWNKTIYINLTVPFLLIRDCLPYMMKNRRGRIINISSIYGFRAIEGNLPYTVSKHGLAGLTKTVAKEYASFNITCNEICPGPVESEMMQRISKKEAEATNGNPEDYLREIRDSIPFGRMAYPDDVASLALYLASPQAGYITGVSISVDGGMTIT